MHSITTIVCFCNTLFGVSIRPQNNLTCLTGSLKHGEGVRGGGGGGGELREERMKVLAVDYALRRETHRASRLAQELQRVSLKRDSPVPLLSPGCIYKVNMVCVYICVLYLEHTILLPCTYSVVHL